MNKIISFRPGILALFLLMTISLTAQQSGQYLENKPLSEVIQATPQDWDISKGTIRVPLIAWGADMQTILANGNQSSTAAGSIFDGKGLRLELFREDIFASQLEAYLKGETPFLRGTMGMINMAAEVANKNPATEPVVIYQLSWSAGGDAMVVRSGINRPADLKGKTVAVQAYGPHVDYLTTVLGSVGLSPSDISIKWVPDLFETSANSFSPAMALQNDSSVDAAMVIIPDALALTSGGSVGTGAEGSVDGARILLSTRTADRIIADVYAVRRDFYESSPDIVQKFVAGLLEGEKMLLELARSKDGRWDDLVGASAGILLDDSNATEDMAGMLNDASLAGLNGNTRFFQDNAYLRRMDVLNQEIQKAFISLGLISGEQSIAGPGFKFAEIVGGADGFMEPVEETRFDAAAVAALVSRKTQEDSLDEGELYSFEIYFSPNQNTFPSAQYENEFQRVLQLVSTYGGALLTIEGHSDPLGYLKQKKNGSPKLILNRIKQSARNLSYTRANAVKDSLMAFADNAGVTIDSSQFGIVGHGIMKPNTSGADYDNNGDLTLSSAPKSKDEWDATRRVVFRLIQIEAETTAFEPLF